MAKPLRASLNIIILQTTILDQLEISTMALVDGNESQTSRVSINPDQLFTRLQEITNNRLRGLCNEMEFQIKKQRIAK